MHGNTDKHTQPRLTQTIHRVLHVSQALNIIHGSFFFFFFALLQRTLHMSVAAINQLSAIHGKVQLGEVEADRDRGGGPGQSHSILERQLICHDP